MGSDSSMVDINKRAQKQAWSLNTVQIPLWSILTSSKDFKRASKLCSDSSMVDINQLSSPCQASATFVQIPLWSILTSDLYIYYLQL